MIRALGEKLTAIIWNSPAETLKFTPAKCQTGPDKVSIAHPARAGERGRLLGGPGRRLHCRTSLGEYSALGAAGSLRSFDTARLLRTRGLAMQKAVPVGAGTMAALLELGCSAAMAVASEAAQGQVCQAANQAGCGGGPVVVSGDEGAVERALEIAKTEGAERAMLLPVSAPFHCKLSATGGRCDGRSAGRCDDQGAER